MADDQVDKRTQVGYGSSWHLLRCLGFQRGRFNAILSSATGALQMDWLDFPPYTGSRMYPKDKPIRDNEWLGLDFLGDSHRLRSDYNAFWPNSGTPINWDAVGRASFAAQPEWLLVEAKAHTGEICKKGTGATNPRSIAMIRSAFGSTQKALGVSATVDDWLYGYYQYANRLATLHFLNDHQEPARLVFVYFCGDADHDHDCPRDQSGWKTVLDDVHKSLGLTGTSDLEKKIHEVFVPVDIAACG